MISQLNNIVNILKKKKAKEIVILDLRGLTQLCDYFIICSSTSEKQSQALLEEILLYTKRKKISIHHIEGENTDWILIDFGDFILHIFSEEARNYWDLEHLWNQAKKEVIE